MSSTPLTENIDAPSSTARLDYATPARAADLLRLACLLTAGAAAGVYALGTARGAQAGAALALLAWLLTAAAAAARAWPQSRRRARRSFHAAPARDYKAFPMVVERRQPPAVYAVSDVHGQYDDLIELLQRYGLVSGARREVTAVRWVGGAATLVVVGDMIDRGPRPVDVLTVLAALQPQAAAAGGEVIVLLGNHEAEFLADPENESANGPQGVNVQIRAMGLTPEEFASDGCECGRWMRTRPLAARLGDWFFCHAGFTSQRGAVALEGDFEAALDRGGFGAAAFLGTDSILVARRWWLHPPDMAARCAVALRVKHIVFGHDSRSLGRMDEFGSAQQGRLIRIDTSHVRLKLLRIAGGRAEELALDGVVRVVWQDADGGTAVEGTLSDHCSAVHASAAVAAESAAPV